MAMKRFLVVAALVLDLVGSAIILMTIHAHQAIACAGINC
jgi:hypothetical protein